MNQHNRHGSFTSLNSKSRNSIQSSVLSKSQKEEPKIHEVLKAKSKKYK